MENRHPGGSSKPPITADAVRHAADALGLGETITRRELRSAYRTLAARHHPDRHALEERADAAERFKEIQSAYRLLQELMENYRYSLRPEDIRRDQEGPIEDYKRRFGGDIWPDQ
ncbi:MAG: J domain-containing protein [Planctomycetes bacterium]|nr:J domain-containing protein [Planctomycetota bacterium]